MSFLRKPESLQWLQEDTGFRRYDKETENGELNARPTEAFLADIERQEALTICPRAPDDKAGYKIYPVKESI